MLLRFHQWFPFVMGGAFVCISFRLIDVSAMDTRVKRSNDYGYDFNVTPVERCPMNKSEHEKAETRMGCNESQSYHCIPDKKHSTLIEFCYPRKQSLVQSGNCLELADTGYLNNVNCEKFTAGCPDTFYLSNEIYNYTACLIVAFGCFTTDKACLQEKFTRTHTVPVCACETENLRFRIFLGLFIVTIIGIFIYSIVGILKRKKGTLCMENITKAQTLVGDDETDPCLISDPEELKSEHFEDGETYPLRGQHQQDETHARKEKNIDFKGCELPIVNISPHDEGPEETKCVDPKGCNLRKSLECKHLLEDVELLILLRRHCSNGAFENFDYLLRTRILNKENDSLKKMLDSLDKDGCSLLHDAAKGGSVDILETLLKHCSERNLNDRDHLGHTLLHIACKHGRYDMCAFLLSKEDYRKSQMNIKSKHQWNAAHFTAECGNYRIFEFLRTKKFDDMKSETENGLNILDIACIYNQIEFFKEIIANHSELKPLLDKSDARGWNITHITARVGNKDILEFLLNGYIDIEVAKKKTCHEKTILHICCEYGHYELCKFIVQNEHLNVMLGDIDHNRWNALHFCAKGGNLDAFKFIESKNVFALDDKTKDCKTALHISCIHKHVEIAKYLCNKLKSRSENINELKTKKFWTAAHYVAVEIKQNGSEEELIRILVDAGIDLSAKTEERKTVLIVACEHRNKNLVRYLVTEHPELLDIEPDLLKKAAECEAEIKNIIDNAFKNIVENEENM